MINNLKDMNENPISSRWKKRFAELPEDIQLKIKELDNKDPKEYQLKVIKKTKCKPKEGDIFLVSPREGIYFYGRVFKAEIKHIANDTFINGKNAVFIFKCKTRTLDLSNYLPNYEELIIDPVIVDDIYWRKGFFYTIANIPIDDYEKELDYGFYSIGKGKYFKEDGHELMHQPQILGTYGIATIIGIARNIEKELIINPNLLKFD